MLSLLSIFKHKHGASDSSSSPRAAAPLDHSVYAPLNLHGRPSEDGKRALLIKAEIQCHLDQGRVVILDGWARSGKTSLLALLGIQILHGRPQDFSTFAYDTQFPPLPVPNGPIAIDDPAMYQPMSLLRGLISLRGRGFVITCQHLGQLVECGVARELVEHHNLSLIRLYATFNPSYVEGLEAWKQRIVSDAP